jgi:phage gp36-like protein
VSYATTDDLASFGLPANATSGLDSNEMDRQLEAASSIADSYLANRGYVLPLTTWDLDLRSAVARIAAWQIVMHHRGVNPNNPSHAALAKSHDDALQWLRDVSAGKANLNVTATTPARANTGVIGVYTLDDAETLRGW